MLSSESAIVAVQEAAKTGNLSPGAVENLKIWLTETRYADYLPQVLEHIQKGQWKALDDAYWTIIPFGTGGRRGRMYPIGSNAINDRTIGESAQGLAEYIVSVKGKKAELGCAIAYDTRHRSRHFAELCASIMVANGFKVYFLDDYRATPQLSFAVREKKCDCGIMVTASHNPPSDNAVKVYWSTGGQVLPPHDSLIIERVMNAQKIQSTPFAEALSAGKVEMITAEIDAKYLAEAVKFSWPGSRDVRVLYSPLHGVGGFAVLPLLKAAGFKDVIQYAPHAEPNGDFPNVPGHVSNPENRVVFDAPIVNAKLIGADIILATDPDCDRMGCAAPLTTQAGSQWATINGNQLGAILADFVLRKMKEIGTLTPKHYVIKTLVTTELIRCIAEGHGARCEGNIHVGFKWIAGLMDELGPDLFAFGTEESHGYVIGTYARDKDGAIACLLMCQLAAELKGRGLTLHEYLDQLFLQHGCYQEDLLNVQMEGSEGMTLMTRLMQCFRDAPPKTIGGLNVAAVRDYKALTRQIVGGAKEPLDAPSTDMVILDLAEAGNYIAVRPSGTEPKVKFYSFSRLSPQASQNLASAKRQLADRLATYRSDIQSYAKSVTQ
ncbi:MAG: phospho-sugar mutase [Pirellulaceae bacterium]|nr:phospho-sugar mutase [Pirellulaceae bacterium]